MSKVINILSGAGAGKSTLAAGLFHEMKKSGMSVELVNEFIKTMAWQGITPNIYDQFYVTGNQSKLESQLYGKVDYIITDSPLLLSPIYEEYYNSHSIVKESVFNFMKTAKNNNIHHINFLLERNVPYIQAGRFQNEETSTKIDELIKYKLRIWEIPFIIIDKNVNNKIEFILNNI